MQKLSASHAPRIAGWPVVAPGLLMTTVDRVVFIHLDDRIDDQGYGLYLLALEASLAQRVHETRVAVVYEIPSFSSLRAITARAAAEVLKRHRDTLRRTTACFALVSPSAVARAAAQTVLTITRLPFPQRTLPTLGAALGFAAASLPELDPLAAERGIERELAAHRREMGG